MNKAETYRRLLTGDLRRLYRHRYGATLPDDDAGRDDLQVLLTVLSLSGRKSADKMRNSVETLAPWMEATEATELIESLLAIDPRYQRASAQEIGERVRLTNREREMLGAYRIVPVDISAEQLVEQRKAKQRARQARRRRQSGVRPRAEYLANALSKRKPWEAEGISRRAWYRRRDTSPSRVHSKPRSQGGMVPLWGHP